MGLNAGYGSYAEMCTDLGYSGRELIVTRVIVEEPRKDDKPDEAHVLKHMVQTALNAFKFARKNEIKR